MTAPVDDDAIRMAQQVAAIILLIRRRKAKFEPGKNADALGMSLFDDFL